MKGLSLANIVIGLLTLLAVALSYFGIVAAIQRQPDFAASQVVTIGGTGDDVTRVSGGTPRCEDDRDIKVEVSIATGSRDNKIEGTAKCTLSSRTATASAADPGNGGSAYDTDTANPGRGQGYCGHTYTADNASTTDSTWLVTCTF